MKKHEEKPDDDGKKKPPRAAKKNAAHEAAKQDIRAYLEGSEGPVDDARVEEVLTSLALRPHAYTIPEFCAMWKRSRATYDRKRALGLTPTETMLWDQPVILDSDLREWEAKLPKRKPPAPPEAPPPVRGRPRRPRAANDPRERNRKPANDERREDIFDEPLPKHLRNINPKGTP